MKQLLFLFLNKNNIVYFVSSIQIFISFLFPTSFSPIRFAFLSLAIKKTQWTLSTKRICTNLNTFWRLFWYQLLHFQAIFWYAENVRIRIYNFQSFWFEMVLQHTKNVAHLIWNFFSFRFSFIFCWFSNVSNTIEMNKVFGDNDDITISNNAQNKRTLMRIISAT